MSETSHEVLDPDQPNIIGPDYFSYYAREVADLLQGDGRYTFNTRAVESESAGTVFENGNRDDSSCSKPLFSNIMDDLDSEVKKGLLKTLLRESVGTLTQEVDEMLDPIVNLRHNLSQLRCKNQQLSSPVNGMPVDDGALKLDFAVQIDEDEDWVKYEQLLEKYTKEHTIILDHMEKQLEAILETTISRCRTMTRLEKQKLKTSIQKLPPKNLDRVPEILFRNKGPNVLSPGEIFVDLEDEDNTTLWRLHFYVMAVDNAKKLAR